LPELDDGVEPPPVPDPVFPVPEEPELSEDEEEEEAELDPPTWPFTVTTVPLMGACRTVPFTARTAALYVFSVE
jgi:hypothetical protein